MTDPKSSLKTLYEDNLDYTALTADNGSRHLNYLVMYEDPPDTFLRDLFITKDYDVLTTVGRRRVQTRRRQQDVAFEYAGRFPIGIMTIDKTGITGDKIRWKMVKEIRRITEANFAAVGEGWRLSVADETDDDRVRGGVLVYRTEIIVERKEYVT